MGRMKPCTSLAWWPAGVVLGNGQALCSALKCLLPPASHFVLNLHGPRISGFFLVSNSDFLQFRQQQLAQDEKGKGLPLKIYWIVRRHESCHGDTEVYEKLQLQAESPQTPSFLRRWADDGIYQTFKGLRSRNGQQTSLFCFLTSQISCAVHITTLLLFFPVDKYNSVLTSSSINSVRKKTNGPGTGSGATGQL